MLTNTMRRLNCQSLMQMNMGIRGFAAMKEYDLAVIGGGPGGKYLFGLCVRL